MEGLALPCLRVTVASPYFLIPLDPMARLGLLKNKGGDDSLVLKDHIRVDLEGQHYEHLQGASSSWFPFSR